ncbi:MAG TPA: hypothetical protein VFQ51_17100 [Vicinamibacteria bacterium]|nr:hypothetical protein [Vicinamibacteria bacterium]
MATVHLFWLLYRYVPTHMAMFEGMGMEIPFGVRLVSAASSWLVRLLPFLVLVALPLAAVALVSFAILAQRVRVHERTVVGWLVALALAVTLAECLASAFVVHAIQGAYLLAATSPAYQQTLRDFDAYRKQQKASQPTPASR